MFCCKHLDEGSTVCVDFRGLIFDFVVVFVDFRISRQLPVQNGGVSLCPYRCICFVILLSMAHITSFRPQLIGGMFAGTNCPVPPCPSLSLPVLPLSVRPLWQCDRPTHCQAIKYCALPKAYLSVPSHLPGIPLAISGGKTCGAKHRTRASWPRSVACADGRKKDNNNNKCQHCLPLGGEGGGKVKTPIHHCHIWRVPDFLGK